jgi:hypothetical protein
MTFEDYVDWTQVNDKLIEGHEAWVTVYVDDLAEDSYLSASAPFPECAKIVKAQYLTPDAATVDQLTVMVKMPAGYDPANGDWWYARYERTGAVQLSAGKLPECIACHQQAAQTDYLFPVEVLAAAQE